MTVKIPAEKLNDFMTQVAHLGMYVTSQRMDVTDKSLDYLSAGLKLKSRTELINQRKKGHIVIKNPSNVLLLKDDMVDEQIGNRQIDDAVKNSIVTLSFYESNTIFKEVIANDDPSAYDMPLLDRLGRAVGNGLALFADFLVGIANLWVFILAGIGLWFLFRYYKNRKTFPAKSLRIE